MSHVQFGILSHLCPNKWSSVLNYVDYTERGKSVNWCDVWEKRGWMVSYLNRQTDKSREEWQSSCQVLCNLQIQWVSCISPQWSSCWSIVEIKRLPLTPSSSSSSSSSPKPKTITDTHRLHMMSARRNSISEMISWMMHKREKCIYPGDNTMSCCCKHPNGKIWRLRWWKCIMKLGRHLWMLSTCELRT